MMPDIKRFLKGLLGGTLALFSLCIFVMILLFKMRGHSRSAASWDPISYIQHFVTVPTFWISLVLSFLVVLLVFSIGFYLGVRKTQ